MMVTKIFIITITVYSVHVYTECTVTLVVLLYVYVRNVVRVYTYSMIHMILSYALYSYF